jgi:hypothetical protein
MENARSTTATPIKPSKAKQNKKLTDDVELNEKGHTKGGFMDVMDSYVEVYHREFGF